MSSQLELVVAQEIALGDALDLVGRVGSITDIREMEFKPGSPGAHARDVQKAALNRWPETRDQMRAILASSSYTAQGKRAEVARFVAPSLQVFRNWLGTLDEQTDRLEEIRRSTVVDSLGTSDAVERAVLMVERRRLVLDHLGEIEPSAIPLFLEEAAEAGDSATVEAIATLPVFARRRLHIDDGAIAEAEATLIEKSSAPVARGLREQADAIAAARRTVEAMVSEINAATGATEHVAGGAA